VVGALDRYADDPMFLVSLAAIGAIESLGDPRHLGTLARIGGSATDGRIRRDAEEAAVRIREGQSVPAQVTGLRDDVDTLRDDHRKLQEKLEALARP